MEKGVPVRAISRSIAVLQCLTRSESPSLMEIARLAHVPYPTASRIVQTLIHEGLVEFEPSRKRYHATCKVEALAAGYRDDDHLVDAAQPHLAGLTKRIGWPVTLSSAVGTTIIVRACTHEQSALTLSHYYRGDSFPLLECAPGHVHLAFSDESTREWLLHALAEQNRRSVALEMFSSGRLVRRIQDDGYAAFARTQHTKDPGKTSTFSLPLTSGKGKLAHLSVNFFASAMPLEEAVRRYLPIAREVAQAVESEWRQIQGPARSPAARTAPQFAVEDLASVTASARRKSTPQHATVA
jgi:IclR family mhp operon transcriptional activator